MTILINNMAANQAADSLVKHQRELVDTIAMLSSGSAIPSSSHDAAGSAISSRLMSQVIGAAQGISNANDGMNMISVAESALGTVVDVLQRMRELALQSANGSQNARDRDYLNKEYQLLVKEIGRIAEDTSWNDRLLLNGYAGVTGETVSLQVGANVGQTISIDFGNIRSDVDVSNTNGFNTASTVGTYSPFWAFQLL